MAVYRMPDPPFNEYQPGPGPGRGYIFVSCAAQWAAAMLATMKKKMPSHLRRKSSNENRLLSKKGEGIPSNGQIDLSIAGAKVIARVSFSFVY
jgi:hypothetical protein